MPSSSNSLQRKEYFQSMHSKSNEGTCKEGQKEKKKKKKVAKKYAASLKKSEGLKDVAAMRRSYASGKREEDVWKRQEMAEKQLQEEAGKESRPWIKI